MRLATIRRGCGVALLGLVAVSRPGLAQSRSAVLRVTAQVVDVGAVTPLPSVASPSPLGAASAAAPTTSMFSVVPPRFAAVAVSMHVQGASPARQGAMAIQVCRPADQARTRCRQVPLTKAPAGREAGTMADEAMVLRLLGLAADVADPALVTLTLAYPGN